MKTFVKFRFVFCMALMVLAVGGCSSGSSDSSEVGVGSSEAAELEARIGVLEQQLASLPAGADGADGADGVDGADGADGVDGADGAVGPVGPPGADGADGIDGVDGAVGPAGEAMTFGVVGATGAAGAAGADGVDGADGAAGPLSGLTCGADEFAASFNGVWQCAVLGVTADGTFSGDGTWDYDRCCDIGQLVNVGGYTSIGLATNYLCDNNFCFFRVVGVADHTVCTITGAIGNSSFNTGSNGVERTVNSIDVNWQQATGFRLDGNGAVSVQVSCGQGVIPAT